MRLTVLASLVLVGACGAKSPTAPEVTPREARFLAFGDSVTAGVQSDGSVLSPYGERVARLLGASVTVAGKPGERVTDAGERFRAALDAAPLDAVLLMHGYNDVSNAEDGETFAEAIEALRELARTARSRSLGVYVATLAPITYEAPRGWGAPYVARFNEELRRMAAEEGVTLVDVTRGWRADYQGVDGLHPNASGQEHFAQAFVGEITRSK